MIVDSSRRRVGPRADRSAGTAAKPEWTCFEKKLEALDAPRRPVVREPLPGLAPRTPADKVKLFRQLFRGRSDLNPTRFVSKKTGKPGYAPDCSNKFMPCVCELPKVKCSDCTRQAFKPVDDAAGGRQARPSWRQQYHRHVHARSRAASDSHSRSAAATAQAGWGRVDRGIRLLDRGLTNVATLISCVPRCRHVCWPRRSAAASG